MGFGSRDITYPVVAAAAAAVHTHNRIRVSLNKSAKSKGLR